MTRLLFSLLIIIPCLARLCYTDIRSRELENAVICLLIPCACFYDAAIFERLAGALFPFLFAGLFGSGDILLFSALGFVFGARDLAGIFAVSAVSSGIFSLAGILSGRLKKNGTIPFAPFIALGTAMHLVFKFAELFPAK